MEILKQKESLLDAVENGLVGADLAEVLAPGGNPLSFEFDLYDCKETVADEKEAYAELAKDVIAFFNSYGGYLLIGVSERKKDQEFILSGFDQEAKLASHLKSALDSYASERIAFHTSPITISGKRVVVIYVPKRSHLDQPVFTVKNGPENKPGRPIFLEKTVFFRRKDECLKAVIPEHWEFLNSDRDARRLLASPVKVSPANAVSRVIPNNLPDRNLICTQLFGRQEIIGFLWAWMADDLAPIRLLAGLGGKGKTSIAYEFASSFYKNAPQPFEQVLWLSAKKFQFRAERNEYMELPECWYSSPFELLESLALATGAATETELAQEQSGEYQLLKMLRDSLRIIPSLVIVDDIDSLDQNDQRKVFEVVQKIAAAAPSKFLLTTRANYAFSNEQCVQVLGLGGDAYKALVHDRLERFGLQPLKAGDITRLEKASDGSPLWTESLLRLVKQGYNCGEAIDEWKGKPGEDARSAALQKELEALSHLARRVLYVAAVLRESSRTELLEVTKVGKQQLDDALAELQALFLVDAPKIIDKEPRFSISEATAAAVVSAGNDLVPDHSRLFSVARGYAKKAAAVNGSGAKRKIGLAINQAISLSRIGDHARAIETADSALKNAKNNPDLLLLRGRCCLPVDTDMAVTAFSNAYKYGQKKPLLFDLWFQALTEKGLFANAIDVCDLALDHSRNPAVWYGLRARTNAQISVQRNNEGNTGAAVSFLSRSRDDLRAALNNTIDEKQKESYVQDLEAVHDISWTISSKVDDLPGRVLAFDVATGAINSGDIRKATVTRVLDAVRKLVSGEDLSSDSSPARAARSRIEEASRTFRFAPKAIGDANGSSLLRRGLLELEKVGS